MSDDQGYYDLSCHGNTVLKTPAIDQLHGESTRLTQFHVSSSCAPTRAALMTGKHPFRSGVTHTIQNRERMSLDSVTLAEVLKGAGYTSGIFGKWHLGDESEYRPDNRGFDEALIHGAGGLGQVKFGDHPDNGKNAYYDPTLYHNGDFVKKTGYCTDIFFNEAWSWILKQTEAKQPYFCYIATNTPHTPDSCDTKYSAPYEGKVPAPKYYGMIANLDENVGTLLKRLKEQGSEEDTLVIFMTDNGHSKKRKWPSNAGQRGAKCSTYQGGIRVPFFVRWAGHFEAGLDVDHVAAHIDILPTLAELAGATVPEHAKVEGMSLLPLLKEEDATLPSRAIYSHNGRWKDVPNKFSSALRLGDYKLVGDKELYNIAEDPAEENNLFSDNPEIAQQLLKQYDSWWDSVQDDLTINQPNLGTAAASKKGRSKNK